MKVKTGNMWLGREWEEAINDHIKTADCWFEECYIDRSESLMDRDYQFAFYKLASYGNRFRKYSTKIPTRYNSLIESLKPNDKFKITDKWGNKITLTNN